MIGSCELDGCGDDLLKALGCGWFLSKFIDDFVDDFSAFIEVIGLDDFDECASGEDDKALFVDFKVFINIRCKFHFSN